MKTFHLLALGCLVAGLTGCTTVNSVENANKEGQRNMVSDMRAVTDHSLSKHVAIVGVNTALTPGGLLKVQVELQNRTRSLQRFIYRFEWFDANGMQVNSIVSAPAPDQIEGRENKMISAVAPTPNCKDFRVKFIEAAE
ncbi:MAG TPA: YcfL family protein [Desulfuromonadaceae bacterium]|nr:YcfL family protein [Desulfuromonadaceae bacterium]